MEWWSERCGRVSIMLVLRNTYSAPDLSPVCIDLYTESFFLLNTFFWIEGILCFMLGCVKESRVLLCDVIHAMMVICALLSSSLFVSSIICSFEMKDFPLAVAIINAFLGMVYAFMFLWLSTQAYHLKAKAVADAKAWEAGHGSKMRSFVLYLMQFWWKLHKKQEFSKFHFCRNVGCCAAVYNIYQTSFVTNLYVLHFSVFRFWKVLFDNYVITYSTILFLLSFCFKHGRSINHVWVFFSPVSRITFWDTVLTRRYLFYR